MQALHTRIKQALALLLVLFTLSSPALLASSITSPSMSSTLDGGAQTITWDTGGQTVEQWAIYAGSSVGSFDYFVSGNIGHATSTTVLFLPIDGTTVYIRLWLKIAGVWEIIDITYFAAQYTLSLASGSTLAGANQNLTWTTNGGTITQWALYAGSSPGNFDYHVGGGANASNSVTTVVSGLPTDSSVVYFQMWMQVGGYWEKLDVSYNAVAPYTITPANGATFTSVSETFTWNTTGEAVDEWAFYAGSSPGNFDYYIDTGTGATSTTSTTATSLPDNGATVYVHIWLKIEGNWEKVELTYTSFEAELISITSPVTDNNLDGSSQQFIWDPQGQTIDSWVLYLGSSLGAFDYHVSSGTGTTTSSVATGLPTNNSMVYARLWYQLSGESFLRKIDETYTAAPLDILWDRTLGSTGPENLRGILFHQGLSSIYAVGQRNSDGVIVSLTPGGTAFLENTFGGSNTDEFKGISTDGTSSFYAAGVTDSNDGDITDGNNGFDDALLVKFDKFHAVIWHRTIGGSSNDRFNDVAVDSAGNVYAAGYTSSNDGDISDGNNGSSDALLVKFDSNGNKLWDKTIGGSSIEVFAALALDASGIYAAGYTESNDGDISDGNNGGRDTLLVKFDNNGNKLWDKKIGGSGNDTFNALALDASGNIYAAGYTTSNDGDITDGNNGSFDTLLVKFDSNGNKLWDKTIGGSSIEVFAALALDASGNIYAAGWTQSNDGDIIDGNNGSSDALLVKFDSNGNKLWDKTIGGSSIEDCAALALDASGNIYAAGWTQSNDGDITDGNNGSSDELIFSLSE